MSDLCSSLTCAKRKYQFTRAKFSNGSVIKRDIDPGVGEVEEECLLVVAFRCIIGHFHVLVWLGGCVLNGKEAVT